MPWVNKDYFSLGTYNVICDRCDTKLKMKDAILEREEWIVCAKCYDPYRADDLYAKDTVKNVSVAHPRPRKTVIYSDDWTGASTN